jgi:dTDP-4-dehydrorhamnose 3,5-epimerase-like enzyme
MNDTVPNKWFLKPLNVHRDHRGGLVAIQAGMDVPFAINRVYYLFGTSAGAERGFHAHRKLQQLAVAVSGSCTFLLDDGAVREEVALDRPDLGLYIGSMVWREMRDFSADCVVMVLASELYDEADYIRSHADFVQSVEEAAEQ